MGEGGSQGAASSQPQLAGAGSLAGQKLGSYTVGKLLGEGGMGRVYLAEHELIGRKAAIKVLSAEVAGHEEVVSRFFTEARAVNDIRHPNIVEVTDFGTHGNQPYIVMEYLEGETLEQRLERERVLSPPTVARVAAQVASALGAAHERGMVHRDLKPANIFLRQHPDYPDFVKVLDFGIAKLLGPSQAKHRTEIGQVIGTPAYMSPEQCLGDVALDQRSDIYSLGVVLYQMLSGRPPFPGDSVGRLLMSHIQETPPSLLTLNPKLPPAVCTVVERAMAKRPEARFGSMRELKEALIAAVAQAMPSAPLNVPGSGAVRIAPVSAAPAPAPHPTPAFATTIAPAPTPGGQEAALKAKLIDIVQARIANETLDLPKLPERVRECLKITANPGFSFATAAAVIAQDSRLRAAMFTLATSADGAARAAATSLEQAIGRLGAQGVRLGIVEIALRDVLEGREERVAEAFRKPMQHAIAVATLMQRLVQLSPAKNDRVAEQESTEAYLTGLLHDVGKPLVATLLLDVEKQLATVRGRRWLIEPLMVSVVEATHQTVGAALARRWGLPEAVAVGIQAPRTVGSKLGETLLLAEALAAQEGFYLRREEQAAVPANLAAARPKAFPDDRTLARVVQGVRDRVLRRA